jgi:hypothetical protein
MRILLPFTMILLFASGMAYGQTNDADQGLFESEATVDEPSSDQVDIPLNDIDDDSSGLRDVETENVTEQTLCCQMSESERAGDDLCANVSCP